MRIVLQRVRFGRVEVDDRVTGEIGPGLLVLLGCGKEDTEQDAVYLVDKTLGLRIFADEAGKMNRSVVEAGGSVLVVSQFTIYGDCRKGRRPSFDQAGRPEKARALYDFFVREMRKTGIRVETGEFQAHMRVTLENDGPVTLLYDSERRI